MHGFSKDVLQMQGVDLRMESKEHRLLQKTVKFN